MADQIQDIMTKEIHTVDAKTPLMTVARLMRDKRIGGVLVTNPNGKLCGIVTDRDIVVRADALAKPLDKTQVGDICSGELVQVAPDASLDEAVAIMRRHSIRRIPVVRDGVPIGIVSIGDLARHKDPKSALADISSAPPNI
jgi:signal-transduction protein with cAMP-binding, CBS, and nucleotidyltransferase domain